MSPMFGQGRTYRTVSGREAVVLAVMPDGRLIMAHVGLSFVPNGDSLDPARVHLRTHDRHGKLIGGEHSMGALNLVPDLSSGGKPISPAMADAFAENGLGGPDEMGMVKAKVGPNGIPIGPRGFQLGIGGTNIPSQIPPAVPSWFEEDDGTIVTPATNEEGVTVRIAIGDPKPPPDPPHPPPLDHPKPRTNEHLFRDPEQSSLIQRFDHATDPERQQSKPPAVSAAPLQHQVAQPWRGRIGEHPDPIDLPDASQPEERHCSIQTSSPIAVFVAAVEALQVALNRVTSHLTDAERHRADGQKLSEIND